MKSTSKKKPVANTDATDTARQTLCSQIALTVRGGNFRLRVRIPTGAGEAWFYEHHNNRWHKQDLVVSDAALVGALAAELALLASKPHGDFVQVRQHDAADWKETDLQFQREGLQGHIDERLESYVLGQLFRDPHDSKQDIRRHVTAGRRSPSRS